jgi:hypothetical protein
MGTACTAPSDDCARGEAVFDSIIDPTVGPSAGLAAGQAALAPRPESLSGLRLGLLANIKRNAEQFLAEVGGLLEQEHGMATALARKKPDITATAPQQMLDDLAGGCDVVVVGVGDCGSCSASAVADGILLEQSGVPVVVVCTEAFKVSADAMADLRGAPGYRYVTTPHPIANLTPDGVRDRAAAAIPAIVGLLTRQAGLAA